MTLLNILTSYLRKNRLIYGLLGLYLTALLLNAAGLPVWLPGCPFKATLGVECWGCGLNRAAIALLSGHLAEAARINALIFIYMPLIVGYAAYDFYKFYVQSNQNYYGQT